MKGEALRSVALTRAGRDLGISELFEATADRVPQRKAILKSGESPLTYRRLQDRTRRLARYLGDRGLGAYAERRDLDGHERGQALLAQYLYNSSEYLEGLLGAYRGRVAPFNVNYRYVAEEIQYLFADSRPEAVQYHASFAPILAEVLPQLETAQVLLQVDDGSGQPLLPGAVDYEEALASVPPEVEVTPTPDDLYVLYTGGTTGMPKAVLWRQADAAVVLLGISNRRDDREWNSLDERLSAIARHPSRVMPLSPYMHGAAQWGALKALCEGNAVVIPRSERTFDPEEVWSCVAAEEVTTISMIGDAFARPLADAIESQPRSLPALRYLISGGAALGRAQRERLVKAIPQLEIIETIGASETGIQGRAASATTSAAGLPRFSRAPGTVVVSEDMTTLLEPGHDGTGWLASSGRVPLGYLGDAKKTAATFPVVEGLRLSVPGDRARLISESEVEVLGREAMTINTGGEKVFAEEVETVLKAHPDVVDALVCGRPSAKWGSEVVAIVQRRASVVDLGTLIEFCATRLARYKLPKAVIFVKAVERGPSGKADYRWAADIVSKGVSDAP